MAILGKLMLVKERFPLPRLVFSPCRFSKTLVLHPIVATSYLYFKGSFISHFSCLLNSVSRNTKFGKRRLLVVWHASRSKSKLGALNFFLFSMWEAVFSISPFSSSAAWSITSSKFSIAYP